MTRSRHKGRENRGKLSKRIALCGLLTATALVLSLVEKMFPLQAVVPIPGVKLGLANVVTLFALHELGIRETAAIVFVRVTLASVFMGSVTGFLFSLFGGILALFDMRLLLPREGSWFSTPGISVAGAAAHNVGQIGAAILVLLAGGLLLMVRSGGFAAAFVRLHEGLFTNDLWLMDPATDVLIRMIPQLFFERAAVSVAARAGASFGIVCTLLLAVYAVVGGMIRRNLSEREQA